MTPWQKALQRAERETGLVRESRAPKPPKVGVSVATIPGGIPRLPVIAGKMVNAVATATADQLDTLARAIPGVAALGSAEARLNEQFRQYVDGAPTWANRRPITSRWTHHIGRRVARKFSWATWVSVSVRHEMPSVTVRAAMTNAIRAAVLHTVAPDQITAEDYELLTGPWRAAGLPLPAR